MLVVITTLQAHTMNKQERLTRKSEQTSLDKTDWTVIFAHPLIGFLIWLTYQQNLIEGEILKKFTSTYLFLLPFILIGFFFRKLRNVKFYLVWLVFAIIHIPIYFAVKDNLNFVFPNGNAFDGLIGLLPTLIMFQILRQLFFRIKGKEMIISIRHYRMTMYEHEEKRNMTWIEVGFSILLMLTAILSGIFLT